MAETNLRVVCKIITCVSAFTEIGNFLEIVKATAGRDTALQATRRMLLWALAIVLATGKNTRLFGVLDHKKTRFFTYVSACREQGRGLRAPTHSSRKTWERSTRELKTLFLWLTDRKQPLNRHNIVRVCITY